MKVLRCTGETTTKSYDISIPVFDDDTVEKVICKIAVDIKRQDPTVDISCQPYVWDFAKAFGFQVTSSAGHFPYNPWKLSADASVPDRYSVTQLSNDIWRKSDKLRIAFINDVPSHVARHPAYFPDFTKKWKVGTYKMIHDEATALGKIWDAGVASVSNDQHVITRAAFKSDVKRTIDMTAMLKSLQPKQYVPVLQFIFDTTKVLYKVLKHHTVSPAILKQLVSYERVPKIQGIIAIFMISSESYARVVLDTTGKLCIYYKLGKAAQYSWDDLVAHNNKIKDYFSIANSITPVSVSVRSELGITRGNVSDFSSHASKQYGIYNVNSTGEIVYKRSTNYRSNLNVIDNIKSQVESGIPEIDIIENLVNNTGMSQKDANEWMNQYRTVISNQDMADKEKRVFFGKSAGCMFKMTSSYGHAFNIAFENLGSWSELGCAMTWIRGVIATMPIKTAKKRLVQQPVAMPQPPPSPKVSPEKLASNNSDAESLGSFADSSSGGAGKTNPFAGYFVQNLKKLDPKVFKVQPINTEGKQESYARMCGANKFRQPVGVKPDAWENIVNQGYVNAVDDYVQYRNNFYFCPRIWCPIGNIPITPDKLVDKDGEKVCPTGEAPIMLDSDHWQDPKGNPSKRYIGFHSKTSDMTPCLPCCMKKPLVGSTRNSKKNELDKCLDKGMRLLRGEKPASIPPKESQPPLQPPLQPPKKEKEKANDPHNILSAPAPIRVDRFGLIPEDIHDVIHPDVTRCTSSITTMPCIVRLGITHGDDSFLHAIAACVLDSSKSKVPNPKSNLIVMIKHKLDPISFLSLDNSHVFQAFATADPITSGSRKETERWLARFPKYVKLLGDNIDIDRQAVIYRSYMNFIAFLQSNDPKSVSQTISLMAAIGIRLVVFERSGQNNAEVYCPSSTISDDATANIAMILKDDAYYEPLVLKARGKRAVHLFREHELGDICTILRSTCSHVIDEHIARVHTLKQWIDATLIASGYLAINGVILRPDLMIHGFTTKSNALMIASDGIPIAALPDIMKVAGIKHIRFMEDLVGHTLKLKDVPAVDLQALSVKAASLGMQLHTDGYEIAEVFDSAYPAIKIPHPIRKQDDDDHVQRLKRFIVQRLITHYDTLIQRYIGDKRSTILRKLEEKLFAKLMKKGAKPMNAADEAHIKQIISIILEQIPLDEGLGAIVRWQRMDLADLQWVSTAIKEDHGAYVFTQVAVESGLPDYIYKSRSGPVPDQRFTAVSEIVTNASAAGPAFAFIHCDDNTETKPLPTKWRSVPELQNYKILQGNDYAKTTVPQLVEYLARRTYMPIAFTDVARLRNGDIIKRVGTGNALEPLTDTSIMMFLKSYPKSLTARTIEGIVKTFGKTLEERSTTVTNALNRHGDSMWSGDLDLTAIAKLFDITVFVIRRSSYGKAAGNDKRGDEADRVASSSMFIGSTNWEERPVIFLSKDSNSPKHSTYHAVVDGQNNFYFPTTYQLPSNVQKVLHAVYALINNE